MRIPPHNLDAERAVLGAILLEGRETLPRVIELLKPSDFYTEAHRVTYQGMLTLFNRSEPVDVLTLTEELRFQRVALIGRYVAEPQILLDGRVHDDAAGYEVLTALELADGRKVLVDRGLRRCRRGQDRHRKSKLPP